MGFVRRLSLNLKFVLKSLFFLQYVPQAFLYSIQRDRLERQYISQPKSQSLIKPGKLLQATATDRGVHFYFEEVELNIDFLTPDFVRVNWSPNLPPIPYAIAYNEWEKVDTKLAETGDNWTISSNTLNIEVGVAGSLTFSNAKGEIIRSELPPQWDNQQWTHQAKLPAEEHIYGLGERAAKFNLRTGKTYQIWNYDPGNIYRPGVDPMYICIPVYLGLHNLGSYLVFYENTFRGEFTFGEDAIAKFADGALRYYFALGEPQKLLERYTQLTGKAPLPAKWTLGYHQSRWGYRTERNVRQEINSFQNHNIPISAIHLDIDCQVGHRAFTIDPKRFPHLRSFIQELAALDIKCVAINNPGIKHSRHSNLFLEGQVLEAFCTYPNGELVVAPVWAGRTVFPDFTNPTVRAWWSHQFAYLLNVGIAGFWNDMSEPALFVTWGDPTMPKVAQHCLEGRGGDHREAHNVYGLLEAEAAFEGIRESRPNQRPFIVSRSGWAGLQRYAWTWTGDIVSTWEALRQTIATVLGLGLSGIAYSGPDIGGFLGNPTPELYVRWFQMASFFTFCRTHSSTSVEPRAPWSFGEPYLSIIRHFLELRYQLMPYFYTLAWETAQKGYPPVRPLFWYDWKDPLFWDREDGFYLGESLLIFPVLQDGVRSQTVSLPSGNWYHFWDDTFLESGNSYQLEAPLEKIPVLVREGSILPMEENDLLILHLYLPKSGESEGFIYSDAGDGYGDFRIDRFHLIRHEQHLQLTWKQEGNYPFPYANVQLTIHGASLQNASVDEQEIVTQGQSIQCQPFQQASLVFDPLL
ncbi:TIM-barrel domain-containing protein [Aerosakkonemataceae cyanobacterium BLCC-F154]|uniref:TIM-barrel domain-containing protein n=1 Tax=Floridaenema fluviatile BLCC-F154 TaxID=3153640 RepID=A0ABV4Y942_9CYAN